MQDSFKIRPANLSDHASLASFLEGNLHIHRHLDWKSPLEWLDSRPFWLLTHGEEILAALACPADPPEIAWVRLFAVTPELPPEKIWGRLFEKARDDMAQIHGVVFAAISLVDWFSTTLKENEFHHLQDIVVLSWTGRQPPVHLLPAGMELRQMVPQDLVEVADVDQRSFAPLWQNSQNSLAFALQKCPLATVIESRGQIVGYQMSTASTINIHLARLAVLPEFQRQDLGYSLVADLLDAASRKGAWQVTVNTQSDNHASLALYNKTGFRETGESFPVYIFD